MGPILHLFGSPTSAFWAELSQLYAGGAFAALCDEHDFLNAHVGPDGLWRLPASPDAGDIAAAAPLSPAEAIARIAAVDIACALPQMFCPAGLSDYRGLIEALGYPMIGNRAEVMALTADKAWTKAIISQAGLATPDAQILRRGEAPAMAPPFVVKPAIADNSQGVALVSKPGEAQAAIAAAFALCNRVLLERFVPLGREVRCGVVEDGDRLVALPLEEYRVDPVERPIRRARDKLSANEGGDLGLMAKTQTEAWIMPLDDPIVPAVHRAALACHRALGCRDHSLFDFRIDPAGDVWFLEAGPYCSFAPESVVVSMMDAAGTGLSDFFAQALDRAVARNTRTKG